MAAEVLVKVGESTRGTALTRILGLKSSPGWMVRAGEAREWRYEGVSERAGSVYLVGPRDSGTTLESALALPLADALPYFGRLVRSLLVLKGTAAGLFPLQSDAVIFTEDAVLFLPPEVNRELRDLRTFTANRDTFECLNHPDLRGEALASFAVASALYRVVTGRFPITGPDAEELHEQARKLEITPPARVVPGLDPEVSGLVMAGLGRGKRGPVTLKEWTAHVETWGSRPLVRQLSTEEREKGLREADARHAGSTRSFRRRMFWQKNWKLAGIVAAGVIAVGVVGGSILKNVLAPRSTRGYAPKAVVETFYSSMNTLDQLTMQSCVIGRAGQGEINEATTLFVTSRVSLGYEGRSNIVPASDWDKAGRPALVSPQVLYGVTGLSITEEKGEPNPIYLVTYEKWTPASAPDTGGLLKLDQAPLSEGHAVKDRVALKKDKGDWVIFSMERLQADLLPAPKVEAAPAASTGGGGSPLSGGP
jgi:hypothetical protein